MIEDQDALVRAIIEALLLLETAGDDEIDPDLAVRGMENIASNLVSLGADDQRRLRTTFTEIASSGDASYSTFVSNLAEMIGLAE